MKTPGCSRRCAGPASLHGRQQQTPARCRRDSQPGTRRRLFREGFQAARDHTGASYGSVRPRRIPGRQGPGSPWSSREHQGAAEILGGERARPFVLSGAATMWEKSVAKRAGPPQVNT